VAREKECCIGGEVYMLVLPEPGAITRLSLFSSHVFSLLKGLEMGRDLMNSIPSDAFPFQISNTLVWCRNFNIDK
jgi:hypothetical protein